MLTSATVVLGGSGLLGRHVVREIGTGTRSVDLPEFDISKLDHVLRATEGAKLIVNCAAWTDVDGAEANEDAARAANATGAENAARAAKTHGAKLVHISTGFVFDGAKPTPYIEDDVPKPLSAYARTKYEGDQRAAAIGGKLFILRTQSLYGEGGRGFASKLRDRIKAGDPLKLDAELEAQPTWVGAVARQVVRLAESEHFGTYHVTCRGRTTWAAFGHAIAKHYGVKPAFQEVRSADFQRAAARPKNFLLESTKLGPLGLDVMPDWSVALAEYLAQS
jgi:dTDP-4-dehydrorhamnose reductase